MEPRKLTEVLYECDYCKCQSLVTSSAHAPRMCPKTNCGGTQSPILGPSSAVPLSIDDLRRGQATLLRALEAAEAELAELRSVAAGAALPAVFNDAYFDYVWRRMGTGDATPSEQQDMALRIETVMIQLRQELAPIRALIAQWRERGTAWWRLAADELESLLVRSPVGPQTQETKDDTRSDLQSASSPTGSSRPPLADSDADLLRDVGIDGRKWAAAFMAQHGSKVLSQVVSSTPTNGVVDEADMLAWFCNAIMAGFDEGQRRAESSSPAARPSGGIPQDARKQIEALPRVSVKGTAPDHEHGYVTERRDHVELCAVLRIIGADPSSPAGSSETGSTETKEKERGKD